MATYHALYNNHHNIGPPPVPPVPTPRRVLVNDPRRNIMEPMPVPIRATPPRPTERGRESSPPLQRQQRKEAPPSPPQVIRDTDRTRAFTRVGFLGEGGFARVYEARDPKGVSHAIKVVAKSNLKTKRAKTKLYAEIKIHRALEHPNIVGFEDCFEDAENVYMSLELCESGSLMDLLKRRKRFTEPESRFFMVQLIGACHYMHTHQVIHRDLKLGNLFLDANMNVKVGDFGLAALIESPGERKKTICGTPNYIAPEVLFDTANGHSFEVDTWSIGVILYTLVVGKPPFQTKDVKAIYKRIRDNLYEFPTDRPISRDARQIISQILTPDPQDRPTLHEILDHAFFVAGTVPAQIPVSAHDSAPDFRHISASTSRANLTKLKKEALLDDDAITAIAAPAPPEPPRELASIAQQEREFQNAVQPGSPISALLSSARQPLLISTSSAPTRSPTLMRKLTAVAPSSVPRDNRVNPRAPLANIQEDGGVEDYAPRKERVPNLQERDLRAREIDSQKARIVSQMVPESDLRSPTFSDDERENFPVLKSKKDKGKGKEKEKEKEKERDADHPKSQPSRSKSSTPVPSSDAGPSTSGVKLNGFDAVAQTLTHAFDAKERGKVFRDPARDVNLPHEKVFIVSWVDYCNKYGMGYALTDGSVGVHFNDSTSIILAPDKHHIDYVSSRAQGTVYVRKNHTISEYPDNLKSKVYLLKHFERYMMDRLYGDHEYTFEDLDRTKGMDFVQKYLRMKHVIVFKLSHGVLQFNFYDHSKVILSSEGLYVTHIDKNYHITRWTLSEIMAQSLRPPVSDPEDQKFNEKLINKLRYCNQVLHSIRTAGSNTSNGLTELAKPVR